MVHAVNANIKKQKHKLALYKESIRQIKVKN